MNNIQTGMIKDKGVQDMLKAKRLV